MEPTFQSCAKGNAIFSAAIGLIIFIILLITAGTSNVENAIGTSVIVIVVYNIISWIFYGYYRWTKNELEYHATVFIIGTIVITAGGWWLGYLLALITTWIGHSISLLIGPKPTRESVEPL